MGSLSAALERTKGVKKKESLPKTDKISLLHYAKLHRSKFQYSDKGKTAEEYKEEVISLSYELEADGKVLEPLIVRKIGVDDYEIIAGQHRRDAAEYNVVVKGLLEFEFLPCIIVNMTEAQAEYATFSTNKTWDQSDWHIMYAIQRKKYLIENFPEDFPHIPDKGRMVDKLSAEMQMAKSTIGEYLQISNNLSEKAMEAFEKQQLNKSAAVAMSSLTHEEQDTLLDEGVIKQKDIKAFKEEKTERIVHRTTVTDTVKSTTLHKVEDDTNALTNNTSDIIDVLPGQYRVTNTDMDIEEIEVAEEKTSSEVVGSNCKCSSCQNLIPSHYLFKFKDKHYCFSCLHNLIIDLAKNGIITIDHSNVDTDGMIIHKYN